MDLAGKTALVTGAAHRLGKAVALALAGEGVSVIVHFGRSRERADATAEEIRALGVEAWTAGADLADEEEVRALFAGLRPRVPSLDLLVNSAANFERGPLLEISAASWDVALAVNLRAPFLCIQEGARWILETSGTGAIVNISDLSGLMPWDGFAQHATAKAGLIHLTRSAARELGPEIRVSCVVPGAILPPPGTSERDPEWTRRGDGIPLGRTGRPEDVARAILFLARHEYITGAVLPVDGGAHLAVAR